MRKIIFVTSIAVLLTALTGCNERGYDVVDDGPYLKTRIYKIEYENHSYLIFDNGGYKGGITHDENCKCKIESYKQTDE